MRPTLLNFRSPKEKTPEYYNVSVTNQGDKLKFRSKSINKKRSNLPQAERFPQYKFFHSGSGVSCFLGPGSYNDHDDFLKLTQNPCPIKISKISVLPESESGKPCYIMIGDNLAFEPSYLSTKQQKQDLQTVNADQCSVHLKTTIQKRSISQIKERISLQMLQSENSEKVGGDSSFLQLTSSFKNQSNYGFESVKQNTYYQTRPQTCSNCKRGVSNLPSGQLNMSISTKASMSGKIAQDFGGTIGPASLISNVDRSTIELSSQKNLVKINEEAQSKENIIEENSHLLTEENQVRIKSMLPKTATNFHKMKKGLYLNPLKGYPYNVKEEALQRSLNILNAYGEILPLLGSQQKKRKSQGSQKKSKIRRNIMNNSATIENSNNQHQIYMNVIRDSPAVIRQREELEKQKREILNMEFDNKWKRKEKTNKELNQFMSERYSDKQSIQEDIQLDLQGQQ